MICARINKLRSAVLLVFILFSMGTGTRLCGAREAGEQGPALGDGVALPAKHTFDLNYRPSEFGFTVLCKFLGRTSFEKEPDFGNRDIVRGLIPIGADKKGHIGFAWDRAKNKLYVDLNRNRDLTDDPNGVFQSGASGRFQLFPRIHLSLQEGTLRLPYEIRMEMSDYGQGRHSCSATVVTGFAGEVTLYGRKWDVTVVDNMNGRVGPGDHLFLAPRDVDLGPGKNWRILNVPKGIFFDSRDYDLSFEFQPGTHEPTLQLTLAESERPMGQLDIDGEHISRLVLESGSSTVLLHHPDRSVSVPAGDYRCRGIYLFDEKAGLFEGEQIDAAGPPSVSVRQDQSVSLKAGGPLNNSVDVRREGNTLILSYKLIGVGRRGYQRLQGRSDKPPTFAIYRGNKRIVSGEFEYG